MYQMLNCNRKTTGRLEELCIALSSSLKLQTAIS